MGHVAMESQDPMDAGELSSLATAGRTGTTGRIGTTGIDRERATAIATRMKAVAHPVRLEVLSRVLDAGAAGTSVRQIRSHVAVGRPTIGHHLNVLYEAGLVSRVGGYPAIFAATPAAHELLPTIEALGGCRISARRG
jgi:ArsR family transcriptional regulator, arsenate/arsenite/antimonite-responsive transcriptional repressor